MTKKLLSCLVCATAVLSLSACTPKKALSNPNPRPMQTLPTIQTEINPAAQLTQAIGKSAATGSFVLRYGTSCQDVQTATEQQVIRGQAGYTSLISTPDKQIFYNNNQLFILSGDSIRQETTDAPYAGNAIFADARAFLPNPNLLRDFSSQRLTVTPEADGSLTYSCGYLDEEELGQILYAGKLPQSLLPGGFANIEGKITFRVDSSGFFTGLQADIDLYQSGSKPDATFTLFVTMDKIGTLDTILTPDWIPTN